MKQMTIFDFINPPMTDLELVLLHYARPNVVGGRESVRSVYRSGKGGAGYLRNAYAPYGWQGGNMPKGSKPKESYECTPKGITIEWYSHTIPGNTIGEHIYDSREYSWADADRVVRSAVAEGRY